MTTQFWRNLGYLLCLVGLWFRIAAAEYGDELRLIVAIFSRGDAESKPHQTEQTTKISPELCGHIRSSF